MMRIDSALARCVLAVAAVTVLPASTRPLSSQAPSASPAAGTAAVQSNVGTVKTVGGGSLLLQTDKGDSVTYALPGNLRVLQLAPGSTDLKTAQPATLSDINQGDRALVSGRSADSGTVTALRVILMKSGAIAQNNAARQQDWQRRGTGGVVNAVDASAKSITVTTSGRKEIVTTTPSTIFRRYAPGSVKFENAQLSKLDSIQPGDQVRVRGDKTGDGATIAADEVVSGAFRNVAGVVTAVDASANTVTVNDLTTKQPVTIALTSDSDLRSLPPEMAARFAARGRGGQAGQAGSAQRQGADAGRVRPADAPAAGASPRGAAGESTPEGGAPRPGAPGAGRGGDLSQVIGRLPKMSVADLKAGQAVMVVASGATASASGLTAITLLSGVEPLLTASAGAGSFNISPWNMGSGGGEGGEGAGPQ